MGILVCVQYKGHYITLKQYYSQLTHLAPLEGCHSLGEAHVVCDKLVDNIMLKPFVLHHTDSSCGEVGCVQRAELVLVQITVNELFLSIDSI